MGSGQVAVVAEQLVVLQGGRGRKEGKRRKELFRGQTATVCAPIIPARILEVPPSQTSLRRLFFAALLAQGTLTDAGL